MLSTDRNYINEILSGEMMEDRGIRVWTWQWNNGVVIQNPLMLSIGSISF